MVGTRELALDSRTPGSRTVIPRSQWPEPGVRNPFPFRAGRNSVRQQQLDPGALLGRTPTLIGDVVFVHSGPSAGQTQTSGEIVHGDPAVWLGLTQLSERSPVWANNSNNPTTA